MASVLMGLQQQGLALTDVKPLDFVIIFGAGKSQGSEHQVQYMAVHSARNLNCRIQRCVIILFGSELMQTAGIVCRPVEFPVAYGGDSQ